MALVVSFSENDSQLSIEKKSQVRLEKVECSHSLFSDKLIGFFLSRSFFRCARLSLLVSFADKYLVQIVHNDQGNCQVSTLSLSQKDRKISDRFVLRERHFPRPWCFFFLP